MDEVTEDTEERLLPTPSADPRPPTAEPEADDVVSSAIGEFGRWQLLHTFLLSLFNIPCTWHIFIPTFHAAERAVWCARPAHYRDVAPHLWINCTGQSGDDYCFVGGAGSGGVADECSAFNASYAGARVACDSWEFGGEGSTIISDFGLVCDKANLIRVGEMMFLAGVAVGGLVCGILSDKYGRKRTLMVSVLIQSVVGTIIAFSPWFYFYAIFRVILGFISVSVVFSGFVLSIELVGGEWRTVAGISYLFPVSLSYMIIAGIGYLLRDWRHLQLAISLPGLLFQILWWVLPESPRWLLALGRTKEVMGILESAARFNQRPLPHNLDKRLQPDSADKPVEDVSVLDLFKTAEMRKRTFIQFLIWFSVYLVYYGLVLNLGNIGGNLYITSVLQGAVEIPAVALSIFILLKGGRRLPLCLTMAVSGAACALVVPIYHAAASDLQWLVTGLAMLSKFCISSSNAIMPVFTAELYPTTHRNIGVGAANVAAGVALMAVPYLWMLASLHQSVPMAVLAVFGIFGGLSVLLLPETGNAPLLDTLREEEQGTRAASLAVDDSKRMNNNFSS